VVERSSPFSFVRVCHSFTSFSSTLTLKRRRRLVGPSLPRRRLSDSRLILKLDFGQRRSSPRLKKKATIEPADPG
jgi:hypothetical protein